LVGRRKIVHMFSDHEPLDALETRAHEDKSGRRGRWIERLQPFNIVVRWKSKAELVAPDALSKSPKFEQVAVSSSSHGGVAAALVSAVHRDAAWWRERQLRDPKLKALINFLEGREDKTWSVRELTRLAAMADGMKMAMTAEDMLV